MAKKKILIVEDDTYIRDVYKEILDLKEYRKIKSLTAEQFLI